MGAICLNCAHAEMFHTNGTCLFCDACPGFRDEPTDREMANRPGVEGGIAYPLEPEHGTWRL